MFLKLAERSVVGVECGCSKPIRSKTAVIAGFQAIMALRASALETRKGESVSQE